MDSRSFDNTVHQLTSTYLALWSGISDAFPQFRRRFSPRTRSTKEREVDRLVHETPFSLDTYVGMNQEERAKVRRKVRTLVVKSLSRRGDGIPDRFFDDSEQATDSFVREAREFDPTIRDRDVHQAVRNLWVFNSIQLYLAHPVILTPSSFAYSLLYPYTDNWLDAAERTESEHESLLPWLTLRLEGKDPPLADTQRVTLHKLLQMIEEEYPRTDFPDVYHALASIHRAQQEGLALRRAAQIGGEEELLALTFTKGGTSVLADGFLVSGALAAHQAHALFGYGVLLQLIDDLQDVDEDAWAGHSNPFSRVVGKRSLDDITNRLFRFSQMVARSLNGNGSTGETGLSRLIEQSVTVIIMESIARYKEFYSQAYPGMIEEFCPLRLSYLEQLRQKLKSGFPPKFG